MVKHLKIFHGNCSFGLDKIRGQKVNYITLKFHQVLILNTHLYVFISYVLIVTSQPKIRQHIHV